MLLLVAIVGSAMASDPPASLLYDVRQDQTIHRDLSFVTVTVTDQHGLTAPRAGNRVHFDISGPGEIVATDNGDPTSFESFKSHDRQAFNGLCLVIVRGKPGQSGPIKVKAKAEGLKVGMASIKTTPEAN